MDLAVDAMPGDLASAYALLEVPYGASPDEVTRSFRDLVKIWHPDRFAHDERLRKRCEAKLKHLNEAYHAITAQRGHPAFTRERPTEPPAGNLTPVPVNGKWGYACGSALVIAAAYEHAEPFSEGRAAVCLDGAWGFLDQRGNLVVAVRFSAAHSFYEGRALVQYGRWGYIDPGGNWVVQPKLQAGLDFNEGVAGARLNDKWGFVGTGGEWLVYPRFDEVSRFENGRAMARHAGQTFAVSRDGTFRRVA